MDSEKKEGSITEMSVYVKKMAPLSIKGTIHHSDDHFSVVEEKEAWNHFQRKDLSMIILDNVDNCSFEGTVQHHKVMTKSGQFIAFNGGAIESVPGFPEATETYITDKEDVIVVLEEVVYNYVGEAVVEEKPVPVPPKVDIKEEAVKDGQKLP